MRILRTKTDTRQDQRAHIRGLSGKIKKKLKILSALVSFPFLPAPNFRAGTSTNCRCRRGAGRAGTSASSGGGGGRDIDVAMTWFLSTRSFPYPGAGSSRQQCGGISRLCRDSSLCCCWCHHRREVRLSTWRHKHMMSPHKSCRLSTPNCHPFTRSKKRC